MSTVAAQVEVRLGTEMVDDSIAMQSSPKPEDELQKPNTDRLRNRPRCVHERGCERSLVWTLDRVRCHHEQRHNDGRFANRQKQHPQIELLAIPMHVQVR